MLPAIHLFIILSECVVFSWGMTQPLLGLSELLPYAKVMLGPLMDCQKPNVLVLGLGGASVTFCLDTIEGPHF